MTDMPLGALNFFSDENVAKFFFSTVDGGINCEPLP